MIVGGALVALEPEPKVVAQAVGGGSWFPLVGRAVLAVTGSRLALVTGGKSVALDVAVGGEVVGVSSLFGGSMISLVTRTRDEHEVIVLQGAGRLAHRIRVPAAAWHAFAPGRGQLLLGTGGDDVVAIDLRYGRVCGEGRAPHAISALAVDEDGREAAIASEGDGGVPVVSMVRCDELITPVRESSTAVETERVVEEPVVAEREEPEVAPIVVDGPREVVLSRAVPYALGVPPGALPGVAAVDAEPFASARDHLAALLELVAARAAVAIAEAWHSGRISADAAGQLPFEREVLGLAGESCELAGDRVARAHERLRRCSEVVAARTQATLHAGIDLPFIAIARELALSEVATQVLLAIVAPHGRPEIARLYRILGNETNRPACDDALVCQLLAGDDAAARDAVLDELAPDSPLVRAGAVVRAGAALEVAPALVARLRERTLPATAAARRRSAVRSLAELHVDRAVVNELLQALAMPRASPVRIVMRGPRGVGRHAVIAAIAARVGYDLVAIDASQLPRAALVDALARELTNALLGQAIPVVSGLEVVEGSDQEAAQRLRQTIAAHRGPVVLRTGLESRLPLEPGFVEVVLRPLAERQRCRAFADALDEVGIAADSELLARRFRIGPGTMQRIARDARARLGRAEPDAVVGTAVVDELARQHVATRIGSAAQRVTRLAEWDQVTLPDDMLDSLRELIGRARHARTVYEDWGYDARITTARGLTALFYGPPGTGKTMVAGLVARELGLELYRVDLSKVVSKWVGETEKNLGEVFDAAEDGQIMLLFDEADSLFAKRSEVKSSNDRYANLEVNYLLQRLDSFEGIAVMTTNLDGSIDPAFKRRLSMRLYFPFPDEEMRARLWETHVMPRMPVAGTLDFAALARKFPLSGGYIRNSALRAAFLAAQEQTALTHAHLERAVLLEYRELGKLSQNGRME